MILLNISCKEQPEAKSELVADKFTAATNKTTSTWGVNPFKHIFLEEVQSYDKWANGEILPTCNRPLEIPVLDSKAFGSRIHESWGYIELGQLNIYIPLYIATRQQLEPQQDIYGSIITSIIIILNEDGCQCVNLNAKQHDINIIRLLI